MSLNAEPFVRGQTGRIRLHVLPTKKFKTYAIVLYAGVPLSEADITRVALLPFVLGRGTASFPETLAFREKLDAMYGAHFGYDVGKRGDHQVVQFRLDVIGDRFVSSNTPLLKEALALLGEVLTAPALEDGRFVGRYVEAEKKTVAQKLDAIINDKIRYAEKRCLEEMFRGEPYRLPALGRKEDLGGIDAVSLYETYRKWLREAAFDLYVVGDTSLEEVAALVKGAFRLPDGPPGNYTPSVPRHAPAEPRTVEERLDVTQGKLNIGLRTPVTYAGRDYPALLVYNGLLGGYPHAKLFVNVREKASLAYYASSRLEGHKGIIMIQTGIDIANYEKALGIIREQLEAMRRGDFTADDLAKTKEMLSNQLIALQDNPFDRIWFDFNARVAGAEHTAEELLGKIRAVTPDDVVRVAETVGLDTVYFLRDRKEETVHARA
ncbi:MAG TPA: pitrilysin family protein [Paenibacillaceae bacterium]